MSGVCCRMGVKGNIDISDLTWEQKEKVLRFLFAKMNGAKDGRLKPTPPALPPVPISGMEQREAWYVVTSRWWLMY